jgi:hypothetical protein
MDKPRVFFCTNEKIFVGLEASLKQLLGSDNFCSGADLFDTPRETDILHIHWPEELVGWQQPDAREIASRLKAFSRTLEGWKQQGVKLVGTIHNWVPHSWEQKSGELLQSLFYEHLDGAVHLGKASESQKRVQVAHEVVIPLSVFENFGSSTVTRAEARSVLGLPNSGDIVFCFGRLRSADELAFVLETFARLPGDVLFVLASSSLPLKGRLVRQFWRLKLSFKKNFVFINKRLTNQCVLNYIAASNVCFSPRLKGLNSGPIIQYISAGRVAVGPRLGNMQDVLESVNNPTYEVGDPKEASRALLDGLCLSRTNRGELNRRYALAEWSSEVCAQRHLDFYNGL